MTTDNWFVAASRPLLIALAARGASAIRTGARLHSLRNSSAAPFILGGAALQRCDNRLIFGSGFSRRGQNADGNSAFPQPLQARRSCLKTSPLLEAAEELSIRIGVCLQAYRKPLETGPALAAGLQRSSRKRHFSTTPLLGRPTNSRNDSVIPTGAKRSGGTLCFRRSSFLIRPFQYAYFRGNTPGTGFRNSTFIILLAILTLTSAASAEWKEKVLYSFQGGANDGATPAGGVVFDSASNLYGATTQGGGDDCPIDQCGTVFELTPPRGKNGSWTETLLHIFKGNGSGDGNTPGAPGSRPFFGR